MSGARLGLPVFLAAAFWGVSARADTASGVPMPDLKRLSLEELSNLQISAVSKTPEPVSGAPAAVYVVTGEEIRRSGATTLAETLRLAPNLQVARATAGDYAVSARGFNSLTANKLLVMIDGRTVYTPLYSGVFWDMQNVPPMDIERIEVVSGPGGALWGSNAVNGVINVVSRGSADTQGGALRISGGNADWNGTAQYSGAFSETGTYRVYVQGLRQGHTTTATGASAGDFWRTYQAGLRTDWALARGSLTVQGDIYDGRTRPDPTQRLDMRGGNVLARWKHDVSAGGALEIQTYYDHTSRSVRGGIRDTLDTYDVAAQHSFAWGSRQKIVWGGGYRVTSDTLTPRVNTVFLAPGSRTLHLGNVFVHDTIALTPAVKLALGLKLENNSYTGWEVMPDARLSWQVTPAHMVWAAVSRAMRTPSRFDRDLYNGFLLAGGPTFRSEELLAYETGYRAQVTDNASLSVSVYYNDYDHLRTVEPPFPLTIQNRMYGHTYGIEAWGTYEPLPWWRLKGGVTAQHKVLKLRAGSATFFGTAIEGNDPDHQVQLRSEMTLPHDVELDVGMRAIASLPSPAVPSYVAVDGRLGWNISPQVQLAVSGFNLLDARHTEFVVSSPPRRDIRRTVYATARWSF